MWILIIPALQERKDRDDTPVQITRNQEKS